MCAASFPNFLISCSIVKVEEKAWGNLARDPWHDWHHGF